MSANPVVLATLVGGIGFGFVTWYYFWTKDDKQDAVKLQNKSVSVSAETERVERVVSSIKVESESVVRTKSTLDVSSEVRTLLKASLETHYEHKETVSSVKEEEKVEVSVSEAPVVVAPVAALDDLAMALGDEDVLAKLEALREKKKGGNKGGKGGRGRIRGLGDGRMAAMDIFDAPKETTTTTTTTTAIEKRETTSETMTSATPSPVVGSGAVGFTFGALEDMNLKGLKRAKKVMSFGKGKPRFEMQDTHCAIVPFEEAGAGGALFCVFDGHAGALCAKQCIDVFPSILSKSMAQQQSSSSSSSSDYSKCLQQSFIECDESLKSYEDEGACAVAALTWTSSDGAHRYVQCANAGDSLALLVTHDGHVEMLSEEHKPTHPNEKIRLQQAGVTLADGATRIPGGLAVSRALGDHFLKSQASGLIGEPYVSAPVVIERGKYTHLLLASDALFDVVEPEQVAAMLHRADPTDSATALAAMLLETACKSTDNATIIVLKFV